MAKTLKYPDEWLSQISAELEKATRAHEEAGVPFSYLPEVPFSQDLRNLIDTSFFASLRQEEGRPVVFRLAYVPSESALSAEWERFIFATPILFDPQAVAKLSPAVDPEKAFLAVEPHAGGGLQIWGLLLRLGLRPVPDAVTYEQPDFLTLTSRRCGTLVVAAGGTSRLFRYTLGRGGLHDIVGPARANLAELVSPVDSSTLRGLGIEVLEQGHGGSIFIIPSGAPIPGCIEHVKYRSKSPCEALSQRKANEKGIQQGYRFVGNLTAVDGAVLLDADLHLIGFGVFVRAPTQDSSREDVRLVVGSTFYDVNRRGARHKSAVWFCRACPDALALVVSQDGEITLFRRKNGEPEIQIVMDVDTYWGR